MKSIIREMGTALSGAIIILSVVSLVILISSNIIGANIFLGLLIIFGGWIVGKLILMALQDD